MKNKLGGVNNANSAINSNQNIFDNSDELFVTKPLKPEEQKHHPKDVIRHGNLQLLAIPELLHNQSTPTSKKKK